MTLTELIQEVYSITNRPDLSALTMTAVRSATLKIHKKDYFPKDLFQTGIVFDESRYIQYIQYRELIPRWRGLKYLRKFDASGTPAPGTAGKFFKIIPPELTLDSYQINREDICYLSGETLHLRSCTELSNALLGCYINPLVGSTDDTYISWIALDHPYAIVHEAAMKVFMAIGNSEEAGQQRVMAAEELQLVITNNILATGY